jgi:hypothetical protein
MWMMEMRREGKREVDGPPVTPSRTAGRRAGVAAMVGSRSAPCETVL